MSEHTKQECLIYTIKLAKEISQCMKSLHLAGIPTLHLITLNLEGVLRSFLDEMGLVQYGNIARRKLPWRPSLDEARIGEDVRPIFWANRPASYVERTSSWESFPSGRWT